MSDSVGYYLSELSQFPLLDAAEERELSQLMEKGRNATVLMEEGDDSPALQRDIKKAKEARDRFIRSNLRLVVSIARRYPLPHGMELIDIIQEGNLGLEHAVEKFDWRKGFKFSTYATFWIRQAIGRALDQKTTLVKLPGDRSAQLRASLRESSGDANELNEEQARLHRLTTLISLDRPIGEEDGSEIIDMLSDSNVGPLEDVLIEERKAEVANILSKLDKRSEAALKLRFGIFDGQTRSFREVGSELGVTAEAARRIVKRSISNLRKVLGSRKEDLIQDFD